MPQTETVLKQALRENVKPVLFINKVDRLINELKLSPEELLKQLTSIIVEVNALIKSSKPFSGVILPTARIYLFFSSPHFSNLSVPQVKLGTGMPFGINTDFF